ncbi:MAG: dUTP diphosphatase [Cetobacterium sp.]|uniref:Deoxyuridine 5'-triphosphate nucleotidohydrolase n=1 Tax=Cetobacterium ceti TaxID=180163 RepID=A0A1T4P4Y0_9FUSO|nr:dUTP diphosphatase [Cetobacterium ceti]MCJ8341686.1 dUTP diphosphatase [Cetobacterium sp.]SJZ86316.1 dUTP pyrophosphatase [Cetobacterium ceti]
MEKVKVKIIRLDGAKDPQYMTPGAAGMDIHAYIEEAITLQPLERKIIGTGLELEFPIGYEIQVRPRSGLSANYGLTVLNSPGTIDSDYRGELKVLLVNLSNEAYTIEPGERVAQIVLAKYEQIVLESAKKFNKTERGNGSFGHTGS